MTTMQRLALSAAGFFALGLAGVAPAPAHHSTAAFDMQTVFKIEGKVTEFRWINPHASIKIRGKADGGRPSGLWTIGMTAPNVLVNQGWTRKTLRPGDEVTMYVHPLKDPVKMKDGSNGALFVGVILANGKTLGQVDGKPPQRASFRKH